MLNKPTMSAFPSTRIHEVLQELGVSYLVFTGVSTNFCVDATARNAADYGYLCTLVDDASGAYTEEWQNNTMDTGGDSSERWRPPSSSSHSWTLPSGPEGRSGCGKQKSVIMVILSCVREINMADVPVKSIVDDRLSRLLALVHDPLPSPSSGKTIPHC